MLNYLQKLIGGSTEPGPAPKLNRERILAMAREAATHSAFANQPFSIVQQREGLHIRHVAITTTLGQQFEVVIDDETGAVVSAQVVGVR